MLAPTLDPQGILKEGFVSELYTLSGLAPTLDPQGILKAPEQRDPGGKGFRDLHPRSIRRGY